MCTRCIMDTSEPTITFDNEGVCRFCRDHEHDMLKKKRTPQELGHILSNTIEQIKADGKGKRYDCIIGLSGGVDSSYVAYLVKELGLRPLGVHFDNGWNAELAVYNIESICKKLDIDLYTHVVDWEEFKDLQLSFLKAGVANAEAPTDHGIFALLYRVARKHGVKHIIDGANTSTEYQRKGNMAGGWAYSDLRQIKGIHDRFGTKKLRSYPTMSLIQKMMYRLVFGIKQFSILDHVEYKKEKVKAFMKEKLDWREYGGKHHESLFTKWHQVVYLVKRFGYDKRRPHLSDLIYSEQITRDQAAHEIEMSPIPLNDILELETYIKKKFGFSDQEYADLISSPPVSYKQYPNDEWLMSLYKRYFKR